MNPIHGPVNPHYGADDFSNAPSATDAANQVADGLRHQAERLEDLVNRLLGRTPDAKTCPTAPGGSCKIALVPAIYGCLDPLGRIEKAIYELIERIG